MKKNIKRLSYFLKIERKKVIKKKRLAHCRRNGESIIRTTYIRSTSRSKRIVKTSDKVCRGVYLVKRNDISNMVKGEASLFFPNELDFDTKPKETNSFFVSLLSNAFTLSKEILPASLYLDFSNLVRLSPECALILIALFSKLTIYSPNTLIRIRKDLSNMSPRAYSVLNQIGFWDYFKNSDITPPQGKESNKKIIRHSHSRQIVAQKIKNMLDEFEIDKEFGKERRSYISRAILEAMNNVLDHAYLDEFTKKSKRNKKFLYDHWWMCCYKNKNETGFTFAIYDDGVGMPITLKKKGVEFITSSLSILKDTELIVRAFSSGDRTRTEEDARGNGLPTIIETVPKLDSVLTVLSNSNYCKFEKNRVPVTRIFDKELSQLGTLLSWRIIP